MENKDMNKPAAGEEKKLVLDNAAIEARLVSTGNSWFYQLVLGLFAIVAKVLFFVRKKSFLNGYLF